MQMRPSRVLRKLRAGEAVMSFKQNFEGSRITEMAAMCGFDCVWTDMEHTAADWDTIERQVLAAKSQDVDLLVRIARGSYSDYVRPLELDASGIMVPHIMSLQDARDVVRMTRFYPLGRRPVDGGNADGSYCLLDPSEYYRQANAERFLIVQIEDPEPLAELDEIAAVPGIDMLFFGPGDFSHAIGAPGQLHHPKVAETRRRVAEVCAAHGKFAGTVSGPDSAAEYLEMGYQFLNMGSDVGGLGQHCAHLMRSFAQASGQEKSGEEKQQEGLYRSAR